jgi:hypothetical protein
MVHTHGMTGFGLFNFRLNIGLIKRLCFTHNWLPRPANPQRGHFRLFLQAFKKQVRPANGGVKSDLKSHETH